MMAPNVGAARVMDARELARLGQARAQHIEDAELELERGVDELLRVEAAGGRANVKLAAELLGVSRSLIYRRLEARKDPNA